MSAAAQPATVLEHDDSLNRGIKKLWFALIALISLWLLTCAILGFLFWRKSKSFDQALLDARFDQFVTDYNDSNDFVQPTVGSIQFLRHGYSISFDHVEYTQNGLVLSGRVGNATQLWISSLALNFSARPYPYKIKDKFAKETFPWWPEDWNIGSAQTSVGVLNPGSTASFTTTIPNVKQTADGMEIAVSFSGERYQYLGR